MARQTGKTEVRQDPRGEVRTRHGITPGGNLYHATSQKQAHGKIKITEVQRRRVLQAYQNKTGSIKVDQIHGMKGNSSLRKITGDNGKPHKFLIKQIKSGYLPKRRELAPKPRKKAASKAAKK